MPFARQEDEDNSETLSEKSVIGRDELLGQDPCEIVDARLVVMGEVVGFDVAPALSTVSVE